MKLEFPKQIFEKKNSNVKFHKKIRPVGFALFNSDRRTDRHVEANSRFSQFNERA